MVNFGGWLALSTDFASCSGPFVRAFPRPGELMATSEAPKLALAATLLADYRFDPEPDPDSLAAHR